MKTWIFQGNPDEYDIDGYLASRPGRLSWLVTRYASEVAVGDRVYLWRNQGQQHAIAGVVAEAIITAPTEMRGEDLEGIPFWHTQGARRNEPQPRALLRLVRVANTREVLRRNWCAEDPILSDLPNLRMQAGTNYKIPSQQALRLEALWGRTGQDWTRNEAVAGLWAYAQTYGQEVSKLPGSPVSNVALLIGRAVTGVYAKVMNFRSLDPRATGDGMSGASETDRSVWQEFYDQHASSLHLDFLQTEFARVWGSEAEANTVSPALSAAAELVQVEAQRLESKELADLLAKYAAQRAEAAGTVQTSDRPSGQSLGRPSTRMLYTRAYDRDPLVIAIARKRANHRCEVVNCGHPSFQTIGGLAYTEVHHIIPLSEGGDDIIENVACLCAGHHREVHLGQQAQSLTEYLKSIRGGPKSPHMLPS